MDQFGGFSTVTRRLRSPLPLLVCTHFTPPQHCGILHPCGSALDSHGTATFLQAGMENMKWARRQSILERLTFSSDDGKCSGAVCELVCGSSREGTGKKTNTRALQPLPLCAARLCTCSTPAPLMHGPTSHFKQSISQQWLSATLASWAAAACI